MKLFIASYHLYIFDMIGNKLIKGKHNCNVTLCQFPATWHFLAENEIVEEKFESFKAL